MTTSLITMIAAVIAVSAVPQEQSSKQSKKAGTITLSGCVSKSDRSQEYTLSDDAEGTFRLTGMSVRKYVGKRIEVVGVEPRLAVKGGLYPTPNVAAQAGAIDPARAATEAAVAGPAAVSASPYPEFKVRSIKPVAGTCEP
jgi:hypothetical protein